MAADELVTKTATQLSPFSSSAAGDEILVARGDVIGRVAVEDINTPVAPLGFDRRDGIDGLLAYDVTGLRENASAEVTDDPAGHVPNGNGKYKLIAGEWVWYGPLLPDYAASLDDVDNEAYKRITADRFGQVITLTNISGGGQNVTASLPAGFSEYAFATGVDFRLSWPATNTDPNPTLTVADKNATYTFTIQKRGAGTIAAGELTTGTIYHIRMTSNTTARIYSPLTVEELAETPNAVRITQAHRTKLDGLPTGPAVTADIVAANNARAAGDANLQSQIDSLSAASVAGLHGPYPDAAAGAAATSDGDQFLVADAVTGRVDLYVNEIGAGVYVMEWSRVRDFATRSILVAAVGAGLDHADGTVIHAGGHGYVRKTGASLSPDLPNWDAVEPITLDHFGAIGDGVADDQDAYDSATFRFKEVHVPTGRTYLVPNPSNPRGRKFTGFGRIVKPVDGGLVQANTDTSFNPVQYRAHVWRVKDHWISGGNADVITFGDSTGTDAYGVVIGTLVRDTLQGLGLGVATVTNNAVGGDQWGSKNLSTLLDNAVTALGRQYHLAIIKFGINDAGGSAIPMETAAETLRTAMRSRLSQIRASANGGYDTLSILIIGPNVLGNNPSNANNRNNIWLERIREINREAALDYQCAYYDPYVEAQNAVGGAERWLDSYLVHPRVNHNLDIWGRALESVFKPFGASQRNRFTNRALAEGTAPVATGGMSLYPLGLTVQRALSTDGYPFSGQIETLRNPDNVCYQKLWGYTNGFAQCKTRNWITSSNQWSSWSGAARELALVNGGEAYGAGLGSPSASRTADALVVLGGVGKGGVVSAHTVITTLPVGYRPAAPMYVMSPRYIAAGAPNHGLMYINTNGDITAIRDISPDFYSFDGICFFAAA